MFGYQEDAIQKKPASDRISQKSVLILELAQGHDFFDYIAETGAFDDKLCRFYFGKILEALEYIHEKKFCHRDMKCENILFTKDF